MSLFFAPFQDKIVIEKAMDVIEGREKTVNIEMTISNEQRAFAATLSYMISKFVPNVTFLMEFFRQEK